MRELGSLWRSKSLFISVKARMIEGMGTPSILLGSVMRVLNVME